MTNLEQVLEHLRAVDEGFYGRIIVRFRAGRAVLITEERDTRLDDEAVPKEGHDSHPN